MSQTSSSTPKSIIERNKRAALRSLRKSKTTVQEQLAQNPSSDLVQLIASLLDTWRDQLNELKVIDKQLLDFLDEEEVEEDLTSEEVEKREIAITADYTELETEFSKSRGQLYAMKERLSQSSSLHRSLNATSNLPNDSTQPAVKVKLPDIPVPKFDGKLKNYTEWHAVFDAMVHENDNLKPIQKLYYLKQAMVNDASSLLKDYPLSDDVYEQAYKHVQERYFNRRAIIAQHFADLNDFPMITYSTIRESLDKLNAIIRGLKVCGIDTVKMSPIFTFHAVRKLPEKLRSEWETSQKDYSSYPSFEPLSTFLSDRCFAYETNIRPAAAKAVTSTEKAKDKLSFAAVARAGSKVSATSARTCALCGQDHYLSQCSTFLSKPVSERTTWIREKKLCSNCFRPGQSSDICRSSLCRVCNKRHNTLLHNAELTSNPASSNQPETKAALTAIVPKTNVILLPTAVVNVIVRGRNVLARVLIDQCSQANLVSEDFVRQNRLAMRRAISTILGVSPHGVETSAAVSLNIESRYKEFRLNLDADVVGQIPYEVSPTFVTCLQNLEPQLELADTNTQSTSIDILIGAEFANRILLGNKKFINDLCFEESQFGWVASGPLDHTKPLDIRCCHLTVTANDVLSKFWEVEDVASSKTSPPEHVLCESHFASTHCRLPDGRFQIRLPFKTGDTTLARTYAQAKNALLRCETKLESAIREPYVAFMQEYLTLGHMEMIREESTWSNSYFIPHLPVLRPDSSTTKLRVVFNASACNSTGVSLNQALMNGPILQPELFDTMLRFRSYPIAFSADISKMYRQISMHPEDRPYQAILWRNDVTEPIRTYHLTTLTYGTTPASFIATKCLQVISVDYINSRPDVARAISSEFYMDDLLSGAYTPTEAVGKASLIHDALMSAQFPLRKYLSNSKEFLDQLDSSLIEPLRPVTFSSSGTAKLLGLQWQPIEDKLRINVKTADISNVLLTKRVISSLIASVYDPLGFVAPITITGKILLQDLWREELSWESPISPELQRKFREFYSDLENLPQFSIPRPYATEKIRRLDIIGFCDASSRAYSAVVYLKAYTDEAIHISIVCAKTKVAPVKALTIPRLELLGAALLTKLIARVAKTLSYTASQARVFCDSTIVLAWLKGPSSKYEVFVRNRIEFVTETLPFTQWSYVRTSENPADLATRGISVDSLINNSLWTSGPPWLSEELLPPTIAPFQEDPPEIRKSYCSVIASTKFNESLIERYSDFDKLSRIVALVTKFAFRLKPSLREIGSLDNINRSLIVICHVTQLVWFQNDLYALQKNSTLPTHSSLAALNPFIDKFGVMRVGGRLEKSTLSYDAKHPIIVHSKSKFAILFVRHVHEKYFHATRSFTLAFVRSRFWLVGGAAKLVKKIFNLCVWCTRMKAETVSQIMGDLPPERVAISRPFTVTGVDFAGPFTVTCTNHRSAKYLKHYAAFFVCFVTRAVHVESVADLTTDAFIAALQRFAARRDVPNTMWSDNATNFVGAKNLLEVKCTELGITWKFISPRSPHQGGIWEAAVKSGKKLLIAASRGATLTEDQLKTVLTQIEAILNSRPLYQAQQSSCDDEINIITAGHFLVGSQLLQPPQDELLVLSPTKRLDAYREIIQGWKTETETETETFMLFCPKLKLKTETETGNIEN